MKKDSDNELMKIFNKMLQYASSSENCDQFIKTLSSYSNFCMEFEELIKKENVISDIEYKALQGFLKEGMDLLNDIKK